MPAVWQRFLAWYLDLPQSGTGEGTAWHLDAGPSAGAEYAPSTLIGVTLAAAVVMLVIAWREAPALDWKRRATLMVLRLLVVALLLGMLARVSLRVDRTELPTVAVLVDTSASMGLSDRYSDRTLENAAKRLTPTGRKRAPTRLQLVQSILSRDHGAWWESLQRSHLVRLYGFDQHLHGAESEDEGRPDEVLSEQARQLTPDGAATAPATALGELLDEYRGSSLAAVVVFTDGIASAGEETRLSRAAPRARDVGVPLYPVAVGSRDPVKDLELYDLLADDVAFLGEPVTLRVRHRSFGLRGQTTTLKLFVEGNSEPLLTREVAAGPDGVSEQVEVTATLPEEGTYQLNLVSAPLPDEVNIANNVVRHRVEVRREQLRVLMVEGMPRWEYRALKPVLERDDTLQLATFLQSADLDFTAEDQTALRGFPITQEELNQYDAIVWGDVDLSALDRRVPERLRSFVGEHGGGLILVAGEQHNPLSYVGTELETLLPVSLSGRGAMSEDMLRNLPRFRLQRTLEGKSRAFLRLADDPAEDDAVWQRLPEEIDWLVPTPLTKPGGQVLAVGPVLVETGEPAPVIVQQRYGQGQVVYHASDSLWTWRRRVEDRYYGRYWSQALRELTAGTRRRTQADVELTSDRQVYAPGDDVQLRLRGTSTTNAAWGDAVNVVVESSAGERFASRLQRRPDGAPVWEGAVQRLPLGEFRAKSGGVTADEPGAVCSFRVEAPDYELRERAAAIQDLQQAARISHGAFHSFADADRVPGNLPRGRSIKLAESRPIPLWNRWEPLLLLIGLLSAEWMLRKRARLV